MIVATITIYIYLNWYYQTHVVVVDIGTKSDIISTTKLDENNEANTTNTTAFATAIDIRNDLYTFQQRMNTIHPIMMKFHDRLQQLDPITQQPRYGTQTKQRVLTMLQSYISLVQVYNDIFTSSNVCHTNRNNTLDFPTTVMMIASSSQQQEEQGNETIVTDNENIQSNQNGMDMVAMIESVAEQERVEQERQQYQLELERQQMIRNTEERRRLEHEQEQEAILIIQQREQEIFRQQTEQLLQQRQMILEEQERQIVADRLYIQSIPNRNSLIGVQEQIQRFIQNWTTHNLFNMESSQQVPPLPPPPPPPITSLNVSLKALYTVFQQIVKHPDNEQYRRIRRDHPQFIHDIGQYPGGVELLICAGFTMGMMDNNTIPSYICKEPNVETDLDGWSNWYDLLKGTLHIIEEEMNQRGIKK